MQLIVNGDDLGYSPGVNQAIFDLHDAGRLDSTSLIINLPHSAAGIEAVLTRPNLKVGVHLNLTRGRPCTPGAQIPSLVTGDGVFHATPSFFRRAVMGGIKLSEVEREARAQIAQVLAAGINVSHLDSHSHWHLLPRFGHLLHKLAAEYHAPRVRTVNLRRTLIPRSILLATADLSPVAGKTPAQTDYLFSLHQWISGVRQLSPMLFGQKMRLLLGRPDVTAELVVHPGYTNDPDFPSDTLSAERRQWELEFIQSGQFTDWLAAVGAEISRLPR